MKLLLDQGLPRAAAQLLREASHDAVHVSEVGRSQAPDAAILGMAASDGRVVVTLDADFHSLLAREAAAGPSVIRIRIEGLKAPQVARLLERVIAECGQELQTGAAVSVEPTRIRVRRLPLGSRPKG